MAQGIGESGSSLTPSCKVTGLGESGSWPIPEASEIATFVRITIPSVTISAATRLSVLERFIEEPAKYWSLLLSLFVSMRVARELSRLLKFTVVELEDLV